MRKFFRYWKTIVGRLIDQRCCCCCRCCCTYSYRLSCLLFTEPDFLLDPVIGGLSNQVHAEHAHRSVNPAQNEEQIRHPIQNVGVDEVTLIRAALGNLK